MSSSAPTTFLIAGGTGRQGGAVVNALLNDSLRDQRLSPQSIYVITRSPTSPSSLALAKRGINLIQGSLCTPAPIFDTLAASRGVATSEVGVFLAQAHGPTELSDAKAFIDAAVAFGVQYFVYSSVDRGGRELSDTDPSPCKVFADKFWIEKHLIQAMSKYDASSASEREGVKSQGGIDVKTRTEYTILRPTWFLDNAYWGFPGRLCMTGWRDLLLGKRMQVLVSADLGRWAVEALLRPDRSGIRNQALSVASQEISFEEVNEIFRRQTGKSVDVSWAWFARWTIWLVEDLRTMFEFIGRREYGADLELLSKYVQPTGVEDWVREVVVGNDGEKKRMSDG